MANFNLSQIDIEHGLNEIHQNRMDNFNKIRTASKRGHEYGAQTPIGIFASAGQWYHIYFSKFKR